MPKSGYKQLILTAHNTLRWSYEVTGYDFQAQRSTVSWKAEIIADDNGAITSYDSKAWTLTVVDLDGIETSSYTGSCYLRVDAGETKTIASGTYQVSHTSSAYGRQNNTFQIDGYAKLEISFDLGAPPSGAKLVSATSFADDENPEITYICDFLEIDGLQAQIKIGSTTISRSVPVVDQGTYIFELTDAERERLCRACTDASKCSCDFTIVTDFGSTSRTHTLSREFWVENASPILSPQVDNTHASYTDIIKGHNEIFVTANATAQKGASITSYHIACGSQSADSSTVRFQDVTADVVRVTATDSRGYSTTVTVSLNMIPYVDLTCYVTDNVSDNGDGTTTTTFTINGQFYQGTVNGKTNALTLLQVWKTSEQTVYGDYTKIEDITYRGSTYTATITCVHSTSSYIQLHLTASDLITTISLQDVSSKPIPVFDWNATSFNFNVPVTVEGNTLPHIVESGTFTSMPSATFYYQKRSDGISECWGNKGFTCSTTSQIGSSGWYEGSSSASNIDFPEGLFIDSPNIELTLQMTKSSVMAFVILGSGRSATQSGSVRIFTPEYITEAMSPSYRIHYMIRGRWK